MVYKVFFDLRIIHIDVKLDVCTKNFVKIFRREIIIFGVIKLD